MLTLDQLLQPVTEDEALDTVFALATSLGFQTTAWQSGEPGLTLCYLLAKLYSDLSKAGPAVARGGFARFARDGWLDLLAESLFDEKRGESVFARHTVVLECAANAGPYQIRPGLFWVGSSSGLRFVSASGGNLAAGGTLSLTVQAESAGRAYNVGLGAIRTLLTPLPGVTCTNTELLQNGTDEEPDESLSPRVRGKWATLAAQAGREAYRFWARKASLEVTEIRVSDDNPLGPGTVRGIIAGSSGAVGVPVVDAVEGYLLERKAKTSILSVESALNQTVLISGKVIFRRSMTTSTAAQARVEAHLDAWFRSLPIGGESGKVLVNAIIGQVGAALGDAYVVFTPDAMSDTAIEENEKAIAAYSLTYEGQ